MVHRKILAAFMLFALLAPYSAARSEMNIDFDKVSKAIVFVYGAKPNGDIDDIDKPLGTAFIVSIGVVNKPGAFYRVLVTARHMVDTKWISCGAVANNPEAIYVRMNLAASFGPDYKRRVGFEKVSLVENGQPNWRHPSDDEADAAAIPFSFDPTKFDAVGLPSNIFATDEETSSRKIGDSIMTAGLLPAFIGYDHNYPIFKFGQISSKLEESAPVYCQNRDKGIRRVKVWLIAADLVPGNSGSPIFYAPDYGAEYGGPARRPMVLGLQSIIFQNTDVAGMTLAKYIRESIRTLQLPDAKLDDLR